MNTPQTTELVDGADLAQRLKVSVGTVVELRRAGRIPFVRIGPKTYRFDVAEVIAALRKAQGKDDGGSEGDNTRGEDR